MKKFISMVMAAAMVVSLVPATAFAANEVTFKVVKDAEYTEEAAETMKDASTVIEGPELQIKAKELDKEHTGTTTWEIELDFENAEFKADIAAGSTAIADDNGGVDITVKEAVEAEDDSIILVLTDAGIVEDDIISIDLADFGLVLTKDSVGTECTVTVSGDLGDSDALVFAAVLEEGLTVTLKDTADVAEEEVTTLEKDLKLEADVDVFKAGQEIELKLSKGFEWSEADTTLPSTVTLVEYDENVLTVTVNADTATIEFEADDTAIEAVDAKVGDVCTITVKAKDNVAGAFKATAEAVDAVVVVGDTVTVSVDEDEDVPVIYSGVNVANYGISDDSDHLSLAVTFEESVAAAFDYKKSFTVTLTEGVFVTDVDVAAEEITGFAASATAIEDAFAAAYEKGEQENFEFKRKAFGESTKPFEFDVTFELIAVPGFEGDVVLTLGGDAFEEEQEVVIATFVAPYKVEAQQNDMIIDYRNTEVPTDIVITEAEAGLWTKGEMDFNFEIDHMTFEDDATFTTNEDESELEVKDTGKLSFKVDVESDDEAGVVTISDIALYMSRSLPAGAYDLELGTTPGYMMMTTDALHTTEVGADGTNYFVADFADWDYDTTFEGETAVVKEAFINVITAGRDQDDASFTKKVIVPVGESYIVAGEETVALDVPAYINAAGYTMLPVRAVATALGINNNNVIWSQAAKQVTILYGQRIITMTVGQSVIYVNGSAIPATAAVEVVDGRAFLGMRDLANALGVTSITWDAATQTATLN